ncbi:MAG: biotin attachment protein [Planctomycetes bacterium]|jgi:pyruvate/2-oxoglutarate dehydrogenase complex dihydrolipoamide acyltransferase (E2) component|nr:biotin attachment protein [Planctomycetota bacterium]
MREPIVVPDLGTEQVVVSVWYVKPGEQVFRGDRLVELLLASATFDVTAPCAGILTEQYVAAEKPVRAGQIVGYLETT